MIFEQAEIHSVCSAEIYCTGLLIDDVEFANLRIVKGPQMESFSEVLQVKYNSEPNIHGELHKQSNSTAQFPLGVPEILENIFVYLDKENLFSSRWVNRTWAKTSLPFVYMTWRIPHMKLYRSHIPLFGKAIPSLVSAFKYVENLILNWKEREEYWNSCFLLMHLDDMPRLKKVEVVDFNSLGYMHMDVWEKLVQKKIGWTICFWHVDYFPRHEMQPILDTIANYTTRTPTFNVSAMEFVHPHSSSYITSQITRCMVNCSSLVLYYDAPIMELLSVLKGHLPNLTKLSMIPFGETCLEETFDRTREAEILTSFLSEPHRQSLASFEYYDGVESLIFDPSMKVFTALAEHCTHLSHLKLGLKQAYTGDDHQLKVTNLFSTFAYGLDMVMGKCQKLKSIQVYIGCYPRSFICQNNACTWPHVYDTNLANISEVQSFVKEYGAS